MQLNEVKKMTLAAFFLTLALVLPFLTGSLQVLGESFLPMHLPILLCGFLCGPKYGSLIGFIAPLLRTALFAMPPLYPVALAMAFELAAYGFFTGMLHHYFKKNLVGIYLSLILAMIAGRIVMGIAYVILLGFDGISYSYQSFISAAFIMAVPGIVYQLVAVPLIVFAYTQVNSHERYST